MRSKENIFPHPLSTLDGAKVLYLCVNAIKGAFTDSEIFGENASQTFIFLFFFYPVLISASHMLFFVNTQSPNTCCHS